MRFIFAILSMLFGCVLQASDNKHIINLLCDMTGERYSVHSGESFLSKLARKQLTVQIEQLFINNDPDNVLTTISFDDGSGDYSFSINDAVQSDNLSNESEYHIRKSYKEVAREIVINRFTGTLEASYQRLMGAGLYRMSYEGICEKQTERKF
jgi:hypothetical protein